MKNFRYLDGVATLALDTDACVGCGSCVEVCPHRILEMRGKKAAILDPDACMECGACATNCPVRAVTVTPGVGCASYLISVWLHKLTGRKVDSACC
ncbi:Ferredoxin-2 [Pseudodesulfovibrio hydrargyri]|uniref:Ferredoxin-2 n=1 Tax=Pseudodesulfovibrio hydrargyri TaxID=2125990 RepID=A0A1J5N1X4_9BACT|nr:mercury methylation ferredoxin HgcB [Pseudodesulfovibrio hydrargyri]OIQ52132.1 Ferredoxin-2 [Pseudodesulfovibrio hydrargyri]